MAFGPRNSPQFGLTGFTRTKIGGGSGVSAFGGFTGGSLYTRTPGCGLLGVGGAAYFGAFGSSHIRGSFEGDVGAKIFTRGFYHSILSENKSNKCEEIKSAITV